MNGKSAYSVVEAIPRYLLAVVACVSFAQFLLLLGVGTGRAAELGGATLTRAILCGAIAGWWFYRAKKRKLIETAVAAHRQRQSAEPPKTEAPSIEPVETGTCASDRASHAVDGKLDSNDPSDVMYEAMGGEHAEQTAASSEVQTASRPTIPTGHKDWVHRETIGTETANPPQTQTTSPPAIANNERLAGSIIMSARVKTLAIAGCIVLAIILSWMNRYRYEHVRWASGYEQLVRVNRFSGRTCYLQADGTWSSFRTPKDNPDPFAGFRLPGDTVPDPCNERPANDPWAALSGPAPATPAGADDPYAPFRSALQTTRTSPLASPAPSESTANKAVDCFDPKTGNKVPDPFGGAFGGHAIKCAPGEIEKPATKTPAPSESTTNKAGVSPRSFANSDTAPPVATLGGTETLSSCPDTIPAGTQAIPFSPEELKKVVGTEATIREIGSFDRSPDDRIYNRVPWEAHLHFSNGTNHCVSSAEVEVTLQHGSSSFREQDSAPQTQVVYDAVLRNGFSIRHDHQEKLQGITRLYLSANPSSGFVDVPTEEIVSVERREIHRVFFHPILRPGNTHFETIILSRRTNEGAEPLAIEYWRVTKVWGFDQ